MNEIPQTDVPFNDEQKGPTVRPGGSQFVLKPFALSKKVGCPRFAFGSRTWVFILTLELFTFLCTTSIYILPMPANLRRIYGKNDWHFITFSCFERRDLLGCADARYLFVAELDAARSQLGFRLGGYVVMPNHVHLLISESPTPSVALHKLKLSFSTKHRKSERAHRRELLRCGDVDVQAPSPCFWEARFYDHNVCSESKRRQKLDYMRANPISRGLVEHPKDWPWSSWSTYETGTAGLSASIFRRHQKKDPGS
jgi:putative transposase